MSTPADSARRAILGVPYDPLKKPERTLLVQAFDEMAAELQGSMTGAIVRDTLADLNLVASAIPSQMAWVVSDPTPANNGIYENVGVLHSPSWQRRADLPVGVLTLLDAGAGTANAIVATSTLPLPAIGGRALLALNIFRNNTGAATLAVNGDTAQPIVTASGAALASGYLVAGMLVLLLDDGTHYRLLSDVASSAIQTAAEAARTAAEAAATIATGAMSVFFATVFSTLALAAAYSPVAAPDYIRLEGYAAAGDGGGALYRKVGSAPAHNGKFSITLSGSTVVWFELASLEPNILMFGADPTGGSSANTAVTNAYGYAPRVIIPTGTFLLDANFNLGNGKTADHRGGIFTSANNSVYSLSNQANIIADRRQIFAGNLVVTNVRVSYDEWFGSVQSTTTDSSAAIQAATDCVKNDGLLLMDGGFKAMGTGVVITTGCSVRGASRYSTIIRLLNANASGFEWTTNYGGGAEELQFAAVAVTPTGGSVFKVADPGVGKMVFDKIIINGAWNAMDFIGNSSTFVNNVKISNVDMYNMQNSGLLCQWCENIAIDHIFGDAQTADCTLGLLRYQDHCQAVNTANSNFSNGHGPSLSVSAASRTSGICPQWCFFDDVQFDDANIGMDLNNCEHMYFTRVWSTSNGRAIHGNAGDGIWVRSGCAAIYFEAGVISNNGQRAVRIDFGATDIFFHGKTEMAGNNVNDLGFWTVDVFGGTTDFEISDCIIAAHYYSWTAGIPVGGIQVRNGASDHYKITDNKFIGLGIEADAVNDNGTGTDKIVANASGARNMYR